MSATIHSGASHPIGVATRTQLRSTVSVHLPPELIELIAQYATVIPLTTAILAGSVTTRFGEPAKDGIGADARFYTPSRAALWNDPDLSTATLLVCDSYNAIIRAVNLSTFGVTTIAGNNRKENRIASGPALATSLHSPTGIAIHPIDQSIWVVDGFHTVRRIHRFTGPEAGAGAGAGDYVMSLVAGGTRGFSDGTGTSAQFNCPAAIAIDSRGAFAIVSDTLNNSLRRIDIAISAASGSGSGSATESVVVRVDSVKGFITSPRDIAFNPFADAPVCDEIVYVASAYERIIVANLKTQSCTHLAGLGSLEPQSLVFVARNQFIASSRGRFHLVTLPTDEGWCECREWDDSEQRGADASGHRSPIGLVFAGSGSAAGGGTGVDRLFYCDSSHDVVCAVSGSVVAWLNELV